jgi:hypothetical protein
VHDARLVPDTPWVRHNRTSDHGGPTMAKKQQQPDEDPSGSVISADGLVGDGVPGPIVPGDPAADQTTADAVARIASGDLASAEKRKALGEIASGLRKRGFADFLRPSVAMAWIGDTVVDVAPRIPVRSLETLRSHFPGLSDDEIADKLVRNAALTSAGIGAVGGGVSAIQWIAPPALLTAPVVLAAETVAVVAVEVKLIGELQELYGQSVPGGHAQRAVTLLQAWAGRRGVNLLVPGRSLAAVLGTAARHELRDRLARRFGRNLTTLGPLFTGAAVAAFLNRRATLKLSEEVRKDLAARRPRQVTG